jgi:hypothetical protein
LKEWESGLLIGDIFSWEGLDLRQGLFDMIGITWMTFR